ncbi:MAG: L-histidine N(alpha)-methyltransferase [Pseudomonadota bacterium]
MHVPSNNKRFQILQLDPQDSFAVLKSDVQHGLFQLPRSLPPKYFYDENGSALFDAICHTEDYYPTRTEAALLQQNAQHIIDQVKPNTCVELGAGTSAKTEVLLSKINSRLGESPFTFFSIDVCYEVLVDSAQRLLSSYKNLSVHSIVGEYIPAIRSLPPHVGPTLYAFIGSSIGNFTEKESVKLLSEVANKMNSNDYFLIGIDRVKDKQVLERAYDDAEGVTAKFNLNVLNVLNSKLGANFELQQFSHQAIYNEQKSQIEMYLVSLCDQEIHFSELKQSIQIENNEKILTEISRKYTKASIQELLRKSGLIEVEHFEPKNEYFSLLLAKKIF